MIVNMKKVNLLLFHKISNDFLYKLQNLGLVHIVEKKVDDADLLNNANIKKKIDELLKLFSVKNQAKQIDYDSTIEDLIKYSKNLIDRKENILNLIVEEEKKVKIFYPWGAFDSETIENLNKHNVFIKFYKVSLKIFNKVKNNKELNIQVINELEGLVYFILISEDINFKLNLEEFIFPSGSYDDSIIKINDLKKELNELEEKILDLSKYNSFIKKNYINLENIIKYQTAKLSLNNHFEKINSMQAWIPADKEHKLKSFLDNEDGIYYNFEKPNTNDKPESIPILLKNNKFTKLFEPITKLFSLPNYAELDVTPFFAPFFALFFGLCLGDAGYGVILLFASIILFFKVKSFKNFALLGVFFSLCTVLWGILSGTLFGINLFENKISVLSNLASFESIHMFYLALLIGLFQIIFAMFVKVINITIYKGFKYSISSIGWIFLVFGLVGFYLKGQNPVQGFTIGELVINFYKSFNSKILMFISIFGVLLILFFNDLKASLPLRIGKGLWELYGITGFFGDLLSYIRLFALGISSAILGTVVNALAKSFLDLKIPGLSHVLFFVFLLVGHTGNLLLAALGAFVHSLRLTFVEFYKNTGFIGGGKPFTPFIKKDL